MSNNPQYDMSQAKNIHYTDNSLQKRLIRRFIGPLYDAEIQKFHSSPAKRVQFWLVYLGKMGFAEFIGTFALVFCVTGIGTVSAYAKSIRDTSQSTFEVDNVSVGLVHGLILCGLIYAFGGISGAHLNPGVSLALALSGSFHWLKLPLYWFAQFAGAFVASTR